MTTAEVFGVIVDEDMSGIACDGCKAHQPLPAYDDQRSHARPKRRVLLSGKLVEYEDGLSPWDEAMRVFVAAHQRCLRGPQ